MGNRNSRRQQEAAEAAQEQPQYPPSQVYRPQAAQLHNPAPPQPQRPGTYPPGPYPSNGQYYGGWQPQPQHPYAQPPPSQPQQPSGASAPQPAAAPPAAELTQTATIRNAVNLKKTTLEVHPVEGSPSLLAISFSFDASAPCRASTFVLATEDAGTGCKLTTARQPAAAAVAYEAGLGLRFPPAGNPSVALAHVVDTSLCSTEELQRSGRGEGYPLVVRLETVTEKGAKDGHTLSELVPGAEQPPWVQSQTTFAQLHREEDGSYSVRVVKQKIWVESVSYELQEIYGLEQASAAARAAAAGTSTADEDDESRLCVICLVNDRDTTVLPCRHMCMCHECAQELRKQTSRCPICRNHVESLLHIKMGYKGARPKADQPLTNAQLAAAEAANAAGVAATANAVAGTAVDGARA